MLKAIIKFSIAPMLLAAATLAPAAQLSTDARGAIPREVQQLVVIDYRAMQNSPAAMDLRDRVMPPELKQLDEALPSPASTKITTSTSWPLPSSAPRPGSDSLLTVGIAQGQFPSKTSWPTSASRRSSRRWSAPTASIP